MPAGRCRAGVAVISRRFSFVPMATCAQGRSPSAPPARRSAPARVVKTRSASDECAAGGVEIVGVLIVAQQHRVDQADLRHRDRGRRCLAQCDLRQSILTWRIEGRIRQQTESVDLDEYGRPSDQRQRDIVHLVCSVASRKHETDNACNIGSERQLSVDRRNRKRRLRQRLLRGRPGRLAEKETTSAGQDRGA